MAFLEAIETYSKHRDRLVEIIASQAQALRVHSIGKPRRHLLCRLDDYMAVTNADSGSDIDLLSSSFARTRFNMCPDEETIMFVDGSTETTSGIAHLIFAVEDIGGVTGNAWPLKTILKEFHIYDKLAHHVLIGPETIETFGVFTNYNSSLVLRTGLEDFSSLNIIRHLQKLNFPSLKNVVDHFKRLVKPGASI
jgi:hypothetical protein